MSGLFTRIQGYDNANPISSSNPLPVQIAGGQSGANTTSVTGNVAATATTINFTAPSTHFTISIGGTTPAITYLALTGNATTSSYAINQPATAGTDTYNGPALSSISIIGASAAGTYSVIAY